VKFCNANPKGDFSGPIDKFKKNEIRKRMKRKISIILSLVAASFLCTVNPAHATQFGFYNISANDVGDAAIGEAQLWVDVTDATDAIGGKVLFTFGNTGPAASSICDVYFDDGSLLGIAIIYNNPGVSFTEGAKPGDLPSGDNASPPFIATAGFTADSDPEVEANGVSPGESLGILFDLQGNQTFADVLSELYSLELRIGIHVQGFESGGSGSFVNSVPDASIMFLLGPSLLALALFSRKKSRK
jgi:hypothetical protein